MRIPTIYLVGAIRDNREDDIEWREEFINNVTACTFLNPVGGKCFDPATKKWSMSGIPPEAEVIVKHDFWCVDHADIIIANMTSLTEGYPSIGSLVELGRASARGSLIYLIMDPNYKGHGNLGMFKLHPFLSQIAAAQFTSVAACMKFVKAHIDVLSGRNPHYGGNIVQQRHGDEVI